MKLSEFVKAEYGKSISECTNEELYYALLTLTKKMASGKQHGNSKKKLYYISAEFLIGKLLSNNLINLGIYDEVKEELAQNGKDICEIEEFENHILSHHNFKVDPAKTVFYGLCENCAK